MHQWHTVNAEYLENIRKLVDLAVQKQWSPFNLQWTDPNFRYFELIDSVKLTGRREVARRMKVLPWATYVSSMTDEAVRVEYYRRRQSNSKEMKKDLPHVEAEVGIKRRWIAMKGPMGYKYPNVHITKEDARALRWQGKTKFTAREHFYKDRIIIHPKYLSYDQRYENYVEECQKLGIEPKPKARYHLIKPSASPQQIQKQLVELKEKDLIKDPPNTLVYFHRKHLVSYQTDAVVLVHGMSMPCYQAALVAATGCSLNELGMPALQPATIGQSFTNLNHLLSECDGLGQLFSLVNDRNLEYMAAADVFKLNEGVYMLHAYYFHPEDVGVAYAEPIHHYIVYNAGTRVLFLYPEVVVLEDEDLNNLPDFLQKLSQVPFQIKLNHDKGSFAKQARRLCIKNTFEASSTRFAFPYLLPGGPSSSP